MVLRICFPRHPPLSAFPLFYPLRIWGSHSVSSFCRHLGTFLRCSPCSYSIWLLFLGSLPFHRSIASPYPLPQRSGRKAFRASRHSPSAHAYAWFLDGLCGSRRDPALASRLCSDNSIAGGGRCRSVVWLLLSRTTATHVERGLVDTTHPPRHQERYTEPASAMDTAPQPPFA